MKFVTIAGARPQFIKAAMVSRALAATRRATEVLVHTGQHYDASLSKVFFDELDLPEPQHQLGVGSASHGAQTGRMLELVEEVLLAERPDRVIVYGDTNSTLAGALAAAKLVLPVAHVEAGLRSFRRSMPEEVNRVLTDHLADLLFAPTETAVENLRREGITGPGVRLVGDVMLDAARFYGPRSDAESGVLARLGLSARSYALVTLHRAENTTDATRLRLLWRALCAAGEEAPVVLPLHPRTRRRLTELGLDASDGRLRTIEPVGYLDMVQLVRHARVVATDSGGVQKEAFFFRVPCLTLREETEWVELVALGWNRLVPPTSERAVVDALRAGFAATGGTEPEVDPFGDGRAAEKMANALLAGPG